MLIYILIPVHNRRIITLNCLNKLQQNEVFSLGKIVVIDDGSTDGTAEKIAEKYPEVHIIKGDGNLWWTGAITQGMKYAYQNDADYIIWLNDDCLVEKNTIKNLVDFCQTKNTIIGARCLDPETKKPSYGGIIKDKLRIKYVYSGECDGLAGNLVCLPRKVIDTIGYPDFRNFPHYYCDVIYTNKAKKSGFNLVILEDAIAFCKDDNKNKNWLNRDYSLKKTIEERFDIGSSSYWSARIRYEYNFLGIYGIFKYLIYEGILKIVIFAIAELVSWIIPAQSYTKIKLKLKSFLDK